MSDRRDDSTPPASQPSSQPGRRTAAVSTRRSRITIAIAVVVPLLTLASLAMVRPWSPDATGSEPESAPLERVDLGCSSPIEDSALAIGSVDGKASGTVAVTALTDGDVQDREARLRGAPVATTKAPGTAVITGRGDLATGLLGARVGALRPAIGTCVPPEPEQWFTGVGARPRHASTVELTNPDRGPAVADLVFLGGRGPLEIDATRGIRVPGRSTRVIDLAALLPTRTELTMHVTVTRGRLSTTVSDRIQEIGGPTSTDWLPAQRAPSTSGWLLGLPTTRGRHTLIVANTGADEARVEVEIVTPTSVFAPTGLDEIRVTPGSTRQVKLDGVLSGRAARDGLGLRVSASEAVTATLRSVVSQDSSLSVLQPGMVGESAALIPGVTGRGSQALVVSGAERTGALTVVTRSESGKRLSRKRQDIAPGRGYRISLPDAARVVTIEVERTTLAAVVMVTVPGTSGGTAVVPLQTVQRSSLIPGVRPVLP